MSEPKGISCPVCGRTASRPILSSLGEGYRRRRRECTEGHRFTTWEVVVPDRLGVGKGCTPT